MIARARTSQPYLKEWAFLACTLLLLSGFIGYTLLSERSNIELRERERLAAQARVVHDNLGRQLAAIDRALVNIRNELQQWKRLGDGMALANRRLEAFTDAMPGVRTMTIQDAKGIAVAASRPGIVGTDFRERDYFQTVVRNPSVDTLYISAPFKTLLGAWGINAVRMIPGPRGEFAGIVTATLDQDEFKILLDSVRYAPDTWTALGHGDGRLFLMMPERPDLAGTDLAKPGSFFSRHRDSGQSATVLTGRVMTTGEQRMMAQHTIQPPELKMDKPLVVAIGRELDALYHPWRREALFRGGLVVLLALITIAGLALSQRGRRLAELNAARAADALADSEHFMRSLIDIIPGMVGYWNADLRCGFANNAYQEWFGKTQQQMRGIRMLDLMGPELFARNEPYIRAALNGERQLFERTLTKADGSIGYTWAHYIPDIFNGEIRGFFVMVADITELKQAQLQLESVNAELRKRTAEAESASRAKSLFLANMSHEIRTPISAVMGLLDLMRHTELDARQLDYVEKAQASSRSLLGIINDILDFSKVEAGKLELEHAAFRIDQVLLNLNTMLADAARDKQIALNFDLDPAIPLELNGDALRLQQILLNLVGNGIKFTPRGSVTLSLRARDVTPRRVRIEFSVRDTGIGIPADKLDAIFEGFTQAEASTSRRFGGTGLGLAICRRLVELMGGELTAESQPGRGSRFDFTLTIERGAADASTAADAASAAARPATASPLAGLKLLVVEDNPINQQVARELLIIAGADVDVASGGQSCLDHVALAKGGFDAILMDIQMPGLDGYETTHVLRKEMGLSLPIIAMTANALPADRAACLAAGMDDHIGKPIDLDRLVATILRHCRRGAGPDTEPSAAVIERARRPLPPLPEGFALEEALHRIGGNEELYVRLIASFRRDSQGMISRVGERIRQGDPAGAAKELHALKGLAGTLGASELAKAAQEAENHLRSGRDPTAIARLPEQLEALLTRTFAVLDLIATHFGGAAPAPMAAPAPLPPTARALEQLDALAGLLERNNLRALDLHGAFVKEFGGLPGDQLAPLNSAMERLDFDAAREACRRLREQMAA